MLSATTKALLQGKLQWSYADTEAALQEPRFKIPFEGWNERDMEALRQELARQ